MTFIIASGLFSYDQINNIVEALVHTEGIRVKVPGLSFEDLAQEIRLECIRVMQHFDQKRIGPVPYRFLQVCIRNKLYNMRRGLHVPNNPPCVRCEFWNKKTKSCDINEENCDKIVEYRNNMSIKASLRKPAAVDISENIELQTNSVATAFILDDSIKTILPKELISSYELMKAGQQDRVSNKDKRKIRDLVRKLIDDA